MIRSQRVVIGLAALGVAVVALTVAIATSPAVPVPARDDASHVQVTGDHGESFVHVMDGGFTRDMDVVDVLEDADIVFRGSVDDVGTIRFNTPDGHRPLGEYSDDRQNEYNLYTPTVIAIHDVLTGLSPQVTKVIVPAYGGELDNVRHDSESLPRMAVGQEGVAVLYDVPPAWESHPVWQYLTERAEALSVGGESVVVAVPGDFFQEDDGLMYGGSGRYRFSVEEFDNVLKEVFGQQ